MLSSPISFQIDSGRLCWRRLDQGKSIKLLAATLPGTPEAGFQVWGYRKGLLQLTQEDRYEDWLFS